MKELTPHDPGHCACLRLALNDLTPAAGPRDGGDGMLPEVKMQRVFAQIIVTY